jgi:uncharacterized protein YbjT (DUF2867 family)
MKIFVTGAHGFIGSAVAAELAREGHQVTGLAHTDAAAQKLAAAGHRVHRGDVQDVASLKAGAAGADGVIHCGFIHDFARYAEVCEIDRLRWARHSRAASDRCWSPRGRRCRPPPTD